jgi:predicted DNA-binding transcriptional regulator AlpA
MQQSLIDAGSGSAANSSRIVRPVEVRQKLGVASSTLCAMVAAGKFPKPFVIFPGGRAIGWREHEIEAWLQQRSNTHGGDA